MAKTSLICRLKQFWYRTRKRRNAGFTLLELLVVTAIAATIVSGLVFMVVELMGSDQRESSRTETQRELQIAMDYIANEMREAVFIYTGECLSGSSSACARGGAGTPLTDFLPPSLAANGSSVPIVAFWRQYPIPLAMRNGVCAGATPPGACLNANSYALIVYSLSKADSSPRTWRGNARITRYVLSQYNSAGTANPSYANPIDTSFETWPFADVNGVRVNRQAQRPSDSAAALVDFVDDGQGALASSTPSLATSAFCPDNALTVDNPTTPSDNESIDYTLSPTTLFLNSFGFNNARTSFYVCVSPVQSDINQDVIIYVRGNANGRPGINSNKGFLPTLETRVLARGVLDRVPPP